MTSPIRDVEFVNKAVVFAPKYERKDLVALQEKGAVDMVQIPGVFSKGTTAEKIACKVVIGINEKFELMIGSDDIAAFPCPPVCRPPNPTGLVTLSNFLK